MISENTVPARAGNSGKGAQEDKNLSMPDGELDESYIASLVALVGLPFSRKRNALFGPFHVATILAYMVRNRVCANAAIAAFWADVDLDPRKEKKSGGKRKVRLPTDQWLFRLLGAISPDEMEERCDLMLDAQMRIARGAGIMRDAVVDIVDVHNVAHYGKTKSKHVVRTKHKDGTSKAESYATLLTTSGDYPYCTAATRIVAKRSKASIVAKLVEDRARRGIRASITLLDRGFFAVAVMRAFSERKLHFVMGAVRTAAVKKALDEYIAGTREAISRCTIRSGRDAFTFTFVVVEKIEEDKDGNKKKVYVLYATNLPDQVLRGKGFDIDEFYARRWDIESHYRKLEELRPRTVSRSHGARTFFFFMAVAMLNMWAMYNQRQKEMREEVEAEAALPAPGGPAGPDPTGAALDEDDGEDKEGEDKENDDKESPELANLGGDGGPDCDEMIRLAVSVQNRPKRKYYKISLVFLIGVVAKFRKSILSWRYQRDKITRRIEWFVESAGAAL